MTLRTCRVWLYFVFSIALVLICMQSYEKPTYAAPSVNIQKSVMDKAIYQGVYKCYTTTGMLKPSLNLRDYHDMGSLMGENAGHADFVNLVSGSHDGPMSDFINSGVLRYNEGDDALSCRQLFVGRSTGRGDNSGILEATGNGAPDKSKVNEVVKFFENMGYDVTETVGGGVCYSVVFNKGYAPNSVSVQSYNKICQKEDGGLYTEPKIGSLAGTGGNVAFDVQSNRPCLRFSGADGEELKCGELVDASGNSTSTLDRSTLDATIKKKICTDRQGLCMIGSSSTNGVEAYKYDDTVGNTAEQGSLENRSARFPGYPQHGSSTMAARRAISFLSGGQMGENLGLSKAEIRILYQKYLTDYYEYDIDCKNEHVNTSGVLWYDGDSGELKECSIAREGNSPDRKVHAVDAAGMFEGEIDAGGIIEYLKNDTDVDLAELADVSSSELEDSSEVEPDCRNSGAGKGLGWFLCNILELAGTAVEETYNTFIEPALAVDSRFFTSGEVGKERVPYQAWQQFRDIANIFFVILLLVVIFSQLTGFGIDNYGIKRVLPKLIVSIILINMSYLICTVVIDASNIIGNGMSALFDSLGNGLKDSVMIDGNSVGGVGTVGTAAGKGLVAASMASGLATMVGAIWASGPLILVTLLPSVLGALVAVVFLFFLISARQAVVVVLVVLAPLAIVCNILPNTKSVFDKYLKIFKVMLLVYPITSFLVAGGNYVSKLILQIGGGEDFYLALTSMVVGIVPIFFIPSMIKDAFAGLGKIGGTISGFGKSLGGAYSKAIQGSDLYKNNQAAIAENTARVKGGFDKNGKPLTGRGRTIANILSGGAMGRRRNALQYQQLVAKRGSLEAADEPDFMLKTDTENELKRIIASGEINNIGDATGGMQRSLTEALQSNDPGSRARIRAYTDALSSQGDAGREAVKEAYNTAIQTGNVSGTNASAFASNIVTNHAADYKNNNRSMFEVARGINGANNEFRTNDGQGRYGTTDEYLRGNLGPVQQQVADKGRKQLMTSAKAETMASMDDNAFKETFTVNGTVNLGGLSNNQRLAVGQNAYRALQNTTNMNVERVALLNEVLERSGYKPGPQQVEIV